MLSFKKNDVKTKSTVKADITDGVVFSVKEVETLMAEAENIAMDIKNRISVASQVIFKNLKQENQFEAFTEKKFINTAVIWKILQKKQVLR